MLSDKASNKEKWKVLLCFFYVIFKNIFNRRRRTSCLHHLQFSAICYHNLSICKCYCCENNQKIERESFHFFYFSLFFPFYQFFQVLRIEAFSCLRVFSLYVITISSVVESMRGDLNEIWNVYVEFAHLFPHPFLIWWLQKTFTIGADVSKAGIGALNIRKLAELSFSFPPFLRRRMS